MKISKRFIGVLVLAWCASTVILAQETELQDKFVLEITKPIDRVGGEKAQAILGEFTANWKQSLSENNKQIVQKTSATLKERGLHSVKGLPTYLDLVNKLIASEGDLNGFLLMSQQLSQKASTRKVLQVFERINLLLSEKQLFKSSFHDYLITSSDLKFEYLTPESFEEEVPLPDEENEEESPFDSWDDDEDLWNDEVSETGSETELLFDQKSALPELAGALVILGEGDLILNTKFDSVTISNTRGSFSLEEGIFLASNGEMDWEVAGFAPSEVKTKFTDFSIEVDKTRILAEDVLLSYPSKANNDIKGLFEFKSENRKLGSKRYPRFMSYGNNVQIKLPNSEKISYRGGLSLEGLNLSSRSSQDGPSKITYRNNGSNLLEVQAQNFALNDSVIFSKSSQVRLQTGRDSIYHQAVSFKLDPYNENLTLNRDIKGSERVPFHSSYHNMDINSDVLQFDLSSDSISFYNLRAKEQRPAVVESQDYFNEVRFIKAKGTADFHPLNLLVNYARKINSGSFSLGEVADYSRKNPKVFENAILPLKQYGFINYEKENQLIQLKRSAYHNVLSQVKRKDYDEVQILSTGNAGPNAILDLKSKDLKIKHIDKFFLSKQLEVLVTPVNGEAIISKNRQIRFDGEINTGRFQYFGEDFRFLYDSFIVSLPKIDSIIMTINKKVEGEEKEVQIESRITETSGTLYINRPNNKSNRRELPRFPYFSSQTSGVVYFDDIAFKNGAYSKDVAFDLPSIDLNNLEKTDEKLTFRGVFSSGGILPDFEEDLYLLDDNTLGFEHDIPEEGYPIYGNKGRIYNKISMTKDGLIAEGPIKFLTGTLSSDQFILFEDSVVSKSVNMDMQPGELNGISFPEMLVETVELFWLPNSDSLVFDTQKAPVKLYGGITEFDGLTTVSKSKGVIGDGSIVFNGSNSESDSIHFQDQRFTAQRANFSIDSSDPEKPILDGRDVKLDFNLKEGIASISPENEGDAAIEFPYAQFKTSISNAEWDLEEKKVRMNKPESVDIANSYFYTTNEELDSLSFNATEAIYDIEEQKLNVRGIPYILVADGKLLPENESIEILADAKIEPLQNAQMLLNAQDEFHHLYDGTFQIHSRNEFSGRALYQIVNAEKDTFSIKFDEFDFEMHTQKRGMSKEVAHTISEGIVTEAEEVVASSGFLYKGDVKMQSNKPALELNGSVSLDIPENTELKKTWVKYASTGDIKEIVIDFDESKTEDGDKLTAGLHFDSYGYGMYETLISDKRSPDDLDFFTPGGKMSFDPEKRAYVIQSEERAKNQSPEGQYFSYDVANRSFEIEGKVLFFDPRQALSMVSVSKGKGELANQSIELNSLLALDFAIAPEVLNEIAKDMATVVEKLGLARANSDLNDLTYKMTNLIGPKSAEQYRARALLNYRPLHLAFGNEVFPMVFSNVDLNWNLEQRAFYSKGQLGLSHIFQTDVNALTDGFFEIKKTLEGDEMNVFVQISPEAWYYFSYLAGDLQIYTSSSDLNDLIDGQKREKGEINYSTSEIENVIAFAERFRKDYLGIDEPFELSMPLNLEKEEGFDAFEDEEDDKDGF